jgi:Cof subfamily protein (haloacid dehalogenase superfamily)
MSHPLFVSDLDGTLLQADGRLSDFGRRTLNDLTARGVPFTVASGRTFSSIRRALGDIELKLPVISSDGALISSFASPAPLHLFSMERSNLDRLVEELVAEGFAPVLDIWDGQENLMLSDAPSNPIMEWYHQAKQSERFYRWRHDGLKIPSKSKVISVTVLDRPEWLEPLRDDLEERWGEWFKTDYLRLDGVEDGAALWVQSLDARKERALDVLGTMLGYEQDNVVVFGDGLNDLGMFSGSWHCVAVDNAKSELKERAREVIGHHTSDSVCRYILDRLNSTT